MKSAFYIKLVSTLRIELPSTHRWLKYFIYINFGQRDLYQGHSRYWMPNFRSSEEYRQKLSLKAICLGTTEKDLRVLDTIAASATTLVSADGFASRLSSHHYKIWASWVRLLGSPFSLKSLCANYLPFRSIISNDSTVREFRKAMPSPLSTSVKTFRAGEQEAQFLHPVTETRTWTCRRTEADWLSLWVAKIRWAGFRRVSAWIGKHGIRSGDKGLESENLANGVSIGVQVVRELV